MLGSITSRKSSSISNWLGRQVAGGDDFGRKDTKTRDYALIGAGAGAVVGGVVGTVAGYRAQADTSIEEVWEDRNVTHPRMDGFSHSVTPDYSETCTGSGDSEVCTTEIDGYWHRYSPNIRHRVVGEFTAPTFRNTNFLEPISGGLLGALGGGAIGLVAGIGAAALQKSMSQGEPTAQVQLPREVRERMNDRIGNAGIAGAVVGAGVGALVGVHSGSIEMEAQEVHTRTWSAPVTRSETLGHMPHDHYSFSRWSSRSSGSKAVVRQVPVYDASGQPTFYDKTQTFTTERYGKILGGLAGGAIGAGVGLAAGLAVGVTQKMLAENAHDPASNNKIKMKTSALKGASAALAAATSGRDRNIQPHRLSTLESIAPSSEDFVSPESTSQDFHDALKVKSHNGPLQVQALSCTQCGAPTTGGTCGHCGSELHIFDPASSIQHQH